MVTISFWIYAAFITAAVITIVGFTHVVYTFKFKRGTVRRRHFNILERIANRGKKVSRVGGGGGGGVAPVVGVPVKMDANVARVPRLPYDKSNIPGDMKFAENELRGLNPSSEGHYHISNKIKIVERDAVTLRRLRIEHDVLKRQHVEYSNRILKNLDTKLPDLVNEIRLNNEKINNYIFRIDNERNLISTIRYKMANNQDLNRFREATNSGYVEARERHDKQFLQKRLDETINAGSNLKNKASNCCLIKCVSCPFKTCFWCLSK